MYQHVNEAPKNIYCKTTMSLSKLIKFQIIAITAINKTFFQ